MLAPLVALLLGSAAAEPSPMGPYSTSGEYFYVGGFKAKGGNQDVYLVYPENAPGPLPLVSFAHGCCKNSVNDTETDYDAIFRHLASHGVVVASFSSCLWMCQNRPFSNDQLHQITALKENPDFHPVLAHVDFSRIALMGHSLGGGATITSAASGYPGVLAASAIHPSNGDAANVKVPTFYMCGQSDTTVRCAGVKSMYEKTSASRSVFADLRGAGHLEIQTPLPGGRWDFYIVQLNLCHLTQNATACEYIYRSEMQDALCNPDGLMVDCQIDSGSLEILI